MLYKSKHINDDGIVMYDCWYM